MIESGRNKAPRGQARKSLSVHTDGEADGYARPSDRGVAKFFCGRGELMNRVRVSTALGR